MRQCLPELNGYNTVLQLSMACDITLAYSGQRLVRADDAAPECGFTGATDFLDGASASAEYAYDASGNMLSDSNKGIDAVTYNRLNRPQSIAMGQYRFGFVHDASGSLLQRTDYRPKAASGLPYSLGEAAAAAYDPAITQIPWVTDTVSYCGPFEYQNGALSRVSFPGGYVRGDSAYHYIYDHQGNVRQVVNAATGHVLQENHYYPGGMLFAESTAVYLASGSSANAYRYGEKEFLTSHGLHLSLHGARMYDPALVRFITPDPLCHQTPHLSPYLYCAANPVMLTDPTGLSTKVVDNGNGTYKVIGGALDGDLGIYLCESKTSEAGALIGMTPVETSFYDSDKGVWKDAIIDPNDNSGIDFINSMLNDTPGVWNYSWNAYGGQLYDFKVTNGTETKKDDNKGNYRGMPVPIGRTPMLPVYCSARDIGNMMAGYVMGYNGLPWDVVRKGFDRLESLQKGERSTEGASSQNAQKYGYRWGLNQRVNIEGNPFPHPGYVFMKVFYETMIRIL